MQVDRKQFVASHGKQPRGEGLWWFNLGRAGAWTQVSFNGAFGAALKFAKSEARALGCSVVVVLP